MRLLLSCCFAMLASPALAAPEHFTATMNAAAEVPPTGEAGTGKVDATYDPSTHTLTYSVTWSGLTGPATMAHFHGPAEPGANAGVVVPLGTSPASPLKGRATLTETQAHDLEAGRWYANVHTAAHPKGEIRGQLKP